MKKSFMRFTSLLLSVIMAFSLVSTVPAAAVPGNGAASCSINIGDITSTAVNTFFHKLLYNTVQKLMDGILSAVNAVFPGPEFQNKSEYKSENFYPGNGTFKNESGQGAKWHLGYASASLLTGNELDGSHYIGGNISIKGKKTATEIWDDMRIRVTALNDGTGGTAVLAVLDTYGFANADVREIRSRLAQFAAEHGIASINILSAHQHSVIDTLGMNGDLLNAVFRNPMINLFKLNLDIKNGKNPAFMENLYQVAVKTIEKACNSMEAGSLYYGAAQAGDYVVDNRPPNVNDTGLNRLRFHPDNPGSRETWITTWCAHCVGNGAGNTQVTSDFPYYMEQSINEKANANFQYIMGAGQSDAMNRDTALLGLPEDHTNLDTIKAYGKALAGLLEGIPQTDETVVEPILNIRHQEIFVPLSNRVIIFGLKAGFFPNKTVKTSDGKLEIVSEIGYMELGKTIAAVLVPGEMEQSLIYGGALPAKDTWSGKPWIYPSLQDIIGKDKKILVFGLANDLIGYIVSDNNFMPMLAKESASVEIVSPGVKTASTMITAYEELIGSAR